MGGCVCIKSIRRGAGILRYPSASADRGVWRPPAEKKKTLLFRRGAGILRYPSASADRAVWRPPAEKKKKKKLPYFGGGPGYYDILPPVLTGESDDHPPIWDLGYGCVCIKSIWRGGGAGYDDIHRPVLTGE